MNAGPELDAKVAEALELPGLGWRKRVSCYHGETTYCGEGDVTEDYPSWKASLQYEVKPGLFHVVPSYSTDIAAAWELVEKMIEEGYNHPLIRYDTLRADDAAKWTVAVSDDQEGWRGDAHTAPHAIVLAFLKAKGIDCG